LILANRAAGAAAISPIIAATLILCLLTVEGAVLSVHGQWNMLVPLLAVLLASTVSSIIGFAFSALAGAVLFHVIDSPVHTVQVMIVCSIAIQLYCVVSLRSSIPGAACRASCWAAWSGCRSACGC